ncbi:MAG: hypothetical protein JW736_00575 [Deltaproteobacteria bacterium]|nr:hypothetical protein [Deltaproteobacteria bacterium]
MQSDKTVIMWIPREGAGPPRTARVSAYLLWILIFTIALCIIAVPLLETRVLRLSYEVTSLRQRERQSLDTIRRFQHKERNRAAAEGRNVMLRHNPGTGKETSLETIMIGTESELFSQESVDPKRAVLFEKMKRVEETSIYQWKTTYTCRKKLEGAVPEYTRILPQPRSFIAAHISATGQGIINLRLAQAIQAFQPEKPTTLHISVSLKPRRIDNRHEENAIGRQNGSVSARFIEFYPVKIAIIYENTAGTSRRLGISALSPAAITLKPAA